MFRRLTALLVAAIILAAPGSDCSVRGDDKAKDTKAAARNYEVTMKGNKFDLADITIAVGDTIRWVNDDDGKHSYTPDTDGAPPEVIVEGGGHSPRVKFAQAGTYKYHCKFHPATMKGTVTVR
jgi:plastocyanin